MYYTLGNVGIGNQTPAYTLDISGTSNVLGSSYSTYFITTSDYRIKENPQVLDDSFVVDQLRPVQYQNRISNKTDIGFLAHEVQQIYPFLVEGEKDGLRNQSINYNGFIGILVKEMQELKKTVISLKNEIEIIKNK